jgi:hypothetical protein
MSIPALDLSGLAVAEPTSAPLSSVPLVDLAALDLAMMELMEREPAAVSLYGAEPLSIEEADEYTDHSETYSSQPLTLLDPLDPLLDIDDLFADAAPNESSYESVEAFEQRVLGELLEITGQSVRIAEARTPEKTSDPRTLTLHSAKNGLAQRVPTQHDLTEDDLIVELMSRDLDDMLKLTTPEGSLAHEIRERAIAPMRISLAEVDLLAEHAIRWILKDLGVSPFAAELDAAEAQQKRTASGNVSGTLEDEAIKNKALELKQHLRTLATAATVSTAVTVAP